MGEKKEDKKSERKKGKGGPKRNLVDRAKDRLEVIEYYLKGKNYRDIAKMISDDREYSISHVAVGNDVKFVLNEWKKTRDDKVELYLTIELAKIDKLEREYWEAWEKSKVDWEQKAAKIIKNKDGKEIGGVLSREETSVKHFTEFGDPRFLQGVERCIEKRIALLGLDAEKTLTLKTISETTVFRVKAKELDEVSMKAV